MPGAAKAVASAGLAASDFSFEVDLLAMAGEDRSDRKGEKMEPMESSGLLYSPRQVFWASFFGGPFALTYLLSRNFIGQGRRDEARRYLAIGLAASTLVAVLLVMLPGKLSVGVFIGCAFGGQQFVRDRHFAGAKVPPEDSRIHSIWRAFLSASASFVAWLVVVVLLALVLEGAGFKVSE